MQLSAGSDDSGRLSVAGLQALPCHRMDRPFANIFRPSGAMRSWTAGTSLHRPRAADAATVAGAAPTAVWDSDRRLPVVRVGARRRHLHEVIPTADRTARRELIDDSGALGPPDARTRRIAPRPQGGQHPRHPRRASASSSTSSASAAARRRSQRVRVRDLTRLNASFVASPGVVATDRLRFLRVYLLWGLRGSGGWKEWWSQIDLATRDKVRKNASRNRPLA